MGVEINIFHILFVAPLLAYTAYVGKNKPLPTALFYTLVIISIMVLLYHIHIYRLKTKIE